ncbi:hypothetical protein CYMTET_28007 [Cymbomonas tetramitiformis]|uniref:Uncharacterized protein n=1 Tax=Cymbomonas tetramitiformis TaxID=36881 RepID=A0AAE0FP94_9CHLO|nr:hypothetical protein CYMTET_28007 [Cymbomonas tetramitiformis]
MISDSQACTETSGCEWCWSASVTPSACYSEKFAAKFSSSKFLCDSHQNGPAADVCRDSTDESHCGAQSGCSWCCGGHVGVSCHCNSQENVVKLPAKVFTCS